MKYLFTVLGVQLLVFNFAFSQEPQKVDENPNPENAYYCPEANTQITPKDLCYEECKSKKVLGVGDEKEGLDRSSCVTCVYSYPSVYKTPQFKNVKTGHLNEILKDQKCYDECKPRKEYLGILGEEKTGYEREGCFACVEKYSGVYQVINPGEEGYVDQSDRGIANTKESSNKNSKPLDKKTKQSATQQ